MNVTIDTGASSGALYVLLSGVISAAISGLVAWFAARRQSDVALKEMAVKLGLEEFAIAKEHALKNGCVGVQPPTYFVYLAYMGLKDASKLNSHNTFVLREFWRRNNYVSEELGRIVDEVSKATMNHRDNSDFGNKEVNKQ